MLNMVHIERWIASTSAQFFEMHCSFKLAKRSEEFVFLLNSMFSYENRERERYSEKLKWRFLGWKTKIVGTQKIYVKIDSKIVHFLVVVVVLNTFHKRSVFYLVCFFLVLFLYNTIVSKNSVCFR